MIGSDKIQNFPDYSERLNTYAVSSRTRAGKFTLTKNFDELWLKNILSVDQNFVVPQKYFQKIIRVIVNLTITLAGTTKSLFLVDSRVLFLSVYCPALKREKQRR